MSFENTNILLNQIICLLETKKNYKNINYFELNNLKKEIFNDFLKKNKNIKFELIDDVINLLYNNNFMYNKNICFSNGDNCIRGYDHLFSDIIVPSKYKNLEIQFNKLKNLPQPAQRTKEWYDYRHNRITASDTATAIDLNPYEPVENFIIKKCDPNYPFYDNVNVAHGKKYEPVATMIYEHIYNNRVYEFGALPSEKYNFLGASPDGICSKYSLENTFSEKLGTMLEIKCPITREINTSGHLVGDICPFYYYCQVQQQLICCELDICDFWQCKIIEYNSRQEYLLDSCEKSQHTYNEILQNPEESFTTNLKDIKYDINNKLKKGIILEFYPKKFIPEFENDNIEWKSKYIYPNKLDLNESDYNNWVIKMLDEYKTLYPEIYENYNFNKIIYWKLKSTHNTPITYNNNFFQSILPILKNTWKDVLYYRNNMNKLEELNNKIIKRKKYIKYNTFYKISNNDVIKNKILFLQDKINYESDKDEYTKNKTKNENIDFID
jgi:putative phage-type endonuclease